MSELKIWSLFVRMPELEQYRSEIDAIDSQILILLLKRIEVSKKIGHYKSIQDVAIVDPVRKTKLFDKITEEAKKLGLSPRFVERIYHEIHEESVRVQC